MPKRKQTEEQPGVIYPSKNGNEYTLDGKRYVKNIRKCTLYEKKDGVYYLYCRILERGEHLYRYNKGAEYLIKYPGTKQLWLTDDSGKTIKKAIAAIDGFIDKLQNTGRPVRVDEVGLHFWYKPTLRGAYDAVVVFRNEYDAEFTKLIESVMVAELVLELHRLCIFSTDSRELRDKLDRLLYSEKETIGLNPLYASAVSLDDKVLQTKLKLLYRIADKEECSFLERLLGRRVLPSLSEEYDKRYYVDADTLDVKLLDRSGYYIAHRAYFAMKGSTHSAWTLNPHRKSGVDAAPVDAEKIAFNDYLELFDNES